VIGIRVIIEILHASKYDNGAKVAEELRRLLADKGDHATVHHINEARPKELPPADVYVFGSPTRLGKPIRSMRRFIKKAVLPPGTKYALFATHPVAKANKKGKMPTKEEVERYRRTIPLMDEALKAKGLVKVAEAKVFLDDLNGPLQEGWQGRVAKFADGIRESP
jgi:menaquinone-dependent protoporphyrinogen IX oxidase